MDVCNLRRTRAEDFCRKCFQEDDSSLLADEKEYQQVAMQNTRDLSRCLADLLRARAAWHPPFLRDEICSLENELCTYPVEHLNNEMNRVRASGQIAAIRALQLALDRVTSRARVTDNVDDCPLCQAPLSAGRCIPWPGACARRHSVHAVHAQCLVDFRDRTRNVQALFMCPQCRCQLEEG